MNPGSLGLAISITLLATFSSARAQTAESHGNCVANAACQALFDQAQVQSKAGQLTEAFRSYSLAYQVSPDPRLLYSMARVLHKQRQFVEAIPYYRKFIESNVDDEERKATARTFLAECEAAAPPLELKPSVSEAPTKYNERAMTPIHRRWWFWTIVGGIAAAGIAGGIAGGVIANQNRVPDLSFRPFE